MDCPGRAGARAPSLPSARLRLSVNDCTRRSPGEGVQIAWAVVGGHVRHISEFNRIPWGQRPEARCEACEQPLTFRLGPVRRHHFAHRGSSECVLTTGEGAAHYNTKRFLAAHLAGATRLYVVEPCDEGCGREDPREIAADWDEVAVERLVHPIRPDILLLRRGMPIAAVEVRFTHGVSDAKAEVLAALGIPWVEVEAGLEGRQDPPWSPALPLPFLQYGPREPWTCPRHEEEPVAAPPPPAGQWVRTAPPEPPLLTGLVEWRVRIVDVYPMTGPRTRRLFWMLLEARDGEVRDVLLTDDRKESVLHRERCAEDIEQAARKLHAKFQQMLRYWQRHHGAIYDSPMKWALAEDLFRNTRTEYYLPELYPPRYIRSAEGIWCMRPGVEFLRWEVSQASPPAPTPEELQEDLFGGA